MEIKEFGGESLKRNLNASVIRLSFIARIEVFRACRLLNRAHLIYDVLAMISQTLLIEMIQRLKIFGKCFDRTETHWFSITLKCLTNFLGTLDVLSFFFSLWISLFGFLQLFESDVDKYR